VREISAKYQADLVAKRVAETPVERQNVYHRDELVLFQRDPDQPLPTKLSIHFTGPYAVLTHRNNNVQIQHLATGVVLEVHVERLKYYWGDRVEGYDAALRDADQYVVTDILYWRGETKKRSDMWFYVQYADGDILWMPWSKDLESC
jgi:hypothetical protein